MLPISDFEAEPITHTVAYLNERRGRRFVAGSCVEMHVIMFHIG